MPTLFRDHCVDDQASSPIEIADRRQRGFYAWPSTRHACLATWFGLDSISASLDALRLGLS